MSDVDEAIAAGRVPAGITAAYLKESKDQPAIAGIIFVTVLTFIVVVGRLLSRAFIVRRFGFDDGLALVSLVRFAVDILFCSEGELEEIYQLRVSSGYEESTIADGDGNHSSASSPLSA